MMLEDRYYHSPRTQLTPLVRSVQNSLDVRDKSVSGTDDDMESTAVAPTLGVPGSSRTVSKTPPISAACYVPRIPRTDHRGHFLRGATFQSLDIRDPPRKQYRSVARPATTAFDPPCFPGAKAVHQIYLANQAHPAFYPPPFRRRKNKLLSQIALPFSVPDVVATSVALSRGSLDGMESDRDGLSVPLSDGTDGNDVTDMVSAPYSQRMLSLMLAQPACARLLHFSVCISNELSSSSFASINTDHLDPMTPGADSNLGKSPTIATLSTPIPQLPRQFPVAPSLCLNEEPVDHQGSTRSVCSGQSLEANLFRSVSVVSDSDAPTPLSGEISQLFRPLPAPNVLPLRLGGVLLPGDAVLAVHPKTRRVSSCIWYSNRCVLFPDGTQSYSHPLYRDATQREAAYSAARSIRHEEITDPFVLAGLIFSALGNEISCSPRTRDYDIISLSELVISPVKHLLSADEIKRMGESLVLALSAVKVSM
ncbi:Hypothetical protein GLP15_2152 [Giardia lamblia P15]|uniref:Uncharacterized protein n=1 Tax=Giardia intestinalis (strain P15) TaxID=658858 RepID=E1F6Z4_GIAIA|nr:Hypothetical protein GLP15_2152 [Giardia lamblia P15]